MSHLLFTTPGRAVTLHDVLDAAELRGDVPATDAPGTTLDAAAAESASEDWRVERNLIAGEELDAWLALRHVTHEDFMRHFRGEAPANDTQRFARWWIEGSITRWAARHAQSIAALAVRETPPPEVALDEWHQAVTLRLGGEAALQAWLCAHQRSAVWLEDLAQTEAAHAECRTGLLAPAPLEKELRAQQFPLHRARLALAMLPTLAAARELLVQLRSRPGATLADETAKMGVACKEMTPFIGDLPPDLQQPLLSCRVGECLEPLPNGGGHQIVQLVEKTPPTLDDPEVRLRVQASVLDQCFTELCEPVVRWVIE